MVDILVNYNQDVLKGTLEVLDSSPLRSLVKPGMRVSIKPNMVLAKPPSSGATTHREIVEGLIIYLKDSGVQNIEIIESAWVGDDTKRAYRVCGYDELSRKYSVGLFDLKDDDTCMVEADGFELEVCRKAVETDFLINVPVLKAHCQTRMTCCLKNLKGCIPDREKSRYHSLGLHRPIALLNKAVKTHFCLIDGVCGDLTFEEGGNPVTRNMIIAGQDPLLLDSYCAGLIGYRIDEIKYLGLSHKLGIGRLFDPETEVLELNADKKPKLTKADGGMVNRLAAYINEDGACSACYSALIYALYHAGTRGMSRKIDIGQGFRGKSGDYGCGDCASRHDRFVKGCPPKAVDIVEFLKEMQR